MTQRLLFCCTVIVSVSLCLFLINAAFAFGFLAGASAGIICFFIQNLSAKSAVKGSGSSPLYFMLMAARIVIAAAVVSAALKLGGQGTGAILGVTVALIVYVVSLFRAESHKVLLNEGI
ncbi:MAG: hypothetical protein AB9903_30530 [Vulcanimicrobiota bacterium]